MGAAGFALRDNGIEGAMKRKGRKTKEGKEGKAGKEGRKEGRGVRSEGKEQKKERKNRTTQLKNDRVNKHPGMSFQSFDKIIDGQLENCCTGGVFLSHALVAFCGLRVFGPCVCKVWLLSDMLC